MLNLNPGYHRDDEILQATSYFKRSCRHCLNHNQMEYPLFYLDPKIEGDAPGPGNRWWSRILRELNDVFEAKLLSRMFFCVEYFPYRSRRFLNPGLLPSQAYGFELVRAAMRRKAVVVLMRSRRMWIEAIPELADYPKLIVLRNPRNPVLSRGNTPEGFDGIVRAIKRNK